MTKVFAWPPVGLTAWELTTLAPVSRSTQFFSGRSRTSSFQRSRRLATAAVLGRGPGQNGAGYIENLKRLLDGGTHLVRVECAAPIWALARAPAALRARLVQLQDDGAVVSWTDGSAPVLLTDAALPMRAEPATDGAWPALAVTGLPPGRIVVRPSERVVVRGAGVTQGATVLTEARSDAEGRALIRTIEQIDIAGALSIGEPESIVFEAADLPRAVQPVAGDWAYQWEFREVFADEYEAWEELDPWH